MKTFLHSPVILFTLLAAISGCDAPADPAAAPTNAGKVDDGKTTTPVTPAALPKAGGAPKVLEDSSTRLARRLAEKFDALWDKHPTDGTASLRFLLRLDGKPFGGKLNILSDFRLVVRGANRGATHSPQQERPLRLHSARRRNLRRADRERGVRDLESEWGRGDRRSGAAVRGRSGYVELVADGIC